MSEIDVNSTLNRLDSDLERLKTVIRWERENDQMNLMEALASLKKYQAAVTTCLSEGGVITDGDDTPWWVAIIEAQQRGAQTISKIEKNVNV